MYIFKYAERRMGDPDEPWSIRQTAVYHQQRCRTDESIFLMLHPLYGSHADTQLRQSLKQEDARQGYVQRPINIHILMVTSYLSRWRDYLLYYEDEVQQLVSLLATHLT